MKKINIKNNNENVIKPQKITLINEKQEKYSFTERTKLKAIVQKIINGFDKIYLIDTKDGIKKVKTIKYNNGVLITKFFQERQMYVINSEKLEELISIFLITSLKFKARETYEISNDIVEFNKEAHEIIGFLLNNKYINKENIGEVEELIFNNIFYKKLKIKSLFLRNIKNNELSVLDVKKISINTLRKEIKIEIKKRKSIIEKAIDENDLILETIFTISSIKIYFNFDA